MELPPLFPSWLLPACQYVIIGLFVTATLGHASRPKYREIYGFRALPNAIRNTTLSIPIWAFQLANLALLILPLWWAATALAALIGRVAGASVSADALFGSGLALIYGGFLAHGFLGPGANQRFSHLAESDQQPPTTPKRVAVIGAGMAGLVTAKELQEEGHEVVVFERSDDWGGVWGRAKERGGRAWSATLTSTGSLNTTLSDLPYPVYFPENQDSPMHFTRQQFYEMLVEYERKNDVFSGCLRLHTEVTGMRRVGQHWEIESQSPQGATAAGELFDAVTVCTGLNHEPRTPAFEGLGTFRGLETHVNYLDLDNLEDFADQRVLVVGAGETASDIVHDLEGVGAHEIFISPRGSTVVLARNFGSVAPDYNENRVAYSGPMYRRWGLLMAGVAISWTNIIRPSRSRSPRFRHWFMLMKPDKSAKDFPSIMGSINATKSDYILLALNRGSAKLVSTVERIEAEGARLQNGKMLQVDAIIYCTGYGTKNTFLPDGAELESPSDDTGSTPVRATDLYKLTVHPDLPNVAVIGFARGMVGAITLSSEMQARWWSLVVSGKRELPTPQQMRRHIQQLQRQGRRFSQATRTTMTFAHSLARNDIGCEPDMFKLFGEDKRLWWQVWNGAICGAHFRLHGVQAKPDAARRQLSMPGTLHAPNYVDAVDVGYNILPLAALAIPLSAVLRRVLPIPSTRSALESYI